MNKQVNFAIIQNDDQEMIINFRPPLILEDTGDTPYKLTKEARIKESLSDVLVHYNGSPASVAEFEEKALGLLKDRDGEQVYNHRTIFGSDITATFDKVGVRLQTKNGSMVFIQAGAQDAIIAVKPDH